jgi:hypothetical protein
MAMHRRRDVLLGGTAGTVGAALAGLGLGAAAPVVAAGSRAAQPWLKRAFHMFTDATGESAIRRVELPVPQALQSQWLLRRPAERVTMGSMAPGYLLEYHVANQPNILIPLFGTLVVKLKDGSEWEFRHGDILFAEDCSGGGHISGAGPDGCFSVSVQVPKTGHCLDPNADPADIFAGRGTPRF